MRFKVLGLGYRSLPPDFFQMWRIVPFFCLARTPPPGHPEGLGCKFRV